MEWISMAVAFEWTTPLPTDLMPPLLENTWVTVVHLIVTPILVETRIGITAILTVTVNLTRAVEGLVTTVTKIEILMAATAETGANVVARPLRVVDDTHLSTEGEEVIQEVLPEVAAPQEAVLGITMLRRRPPLPPLRTVWLILPVGKVVLFDWPLLLSSTYTGSHRLTRSDQGQGQGQRSKLFK